MSELSLVELDYRNGMYLTDKQRDHKYLEVYDTLFSPLRYGKVNIFEIGYWYGGSCELWHRYFPSATIKAIDIAIPRHRKKSNLLTNFIAPQGRVSLDLIPVQKLTAQYFRRFVPDIIIDDGSHMLEDQLYAVTLLYPILRQGGMLIVEDIQDIDVQKIDFAALNIPYKIVDNRESTGVSDSVFLLFKKW